jgi:hypothetical protein
MMFANSAARRGQGFGYNIITQPECRPIEHDTFQCAHCNDTVFIEPKDPSPWCSCCDRQWCGRPQCRNCTPFMKKIEAMEAAARSKMLLWRAADNV